MLKIFDKNHNAIGHIVKYKDCKIESELSNGDKTLSFTYLAKHHNLENEMYVRTKDDEYVIKEVPATTGNFPQIVAVLNLEDLQKDMWEKFSVTDSTIDEAARPLLAGTGWIIGECDVIKNRNAGMIQVSTLEAIQKLCIAFMCEPVFDTINKKVSFYNKRGEDKGAYFISGLNLKKLQKKSTSYDYYTRIIPIGANGLTIESANDGKNYLENYQYSNKILTYIWKDESYTDPQALKEDAELKLNDLSKPERAYSADIYNLAKQKIGYEVLSYGLGDTIILIDRETGTREKQRIVKMVEYPQDHSKDTCEIANTLLTFEEMQQKMQSAAEIINYTITGDGRYTGTINVSDILHFEQGVAGSQTVAGINGNISTMQGEVAELKGKYGELEVNFLTAEEAELKYATIESLNVTNQTVHSIQGDYAEFKTVTSQEVSAQRGIIDNLSGELSTYKTQVAGQFTAFDADITNLKAKDAELETALIGTAKVVDLDAVRTRTQQLETDVAGINTLVNGNLTSDNIQSMVITGDKFTMENGFIKSAMIDSLAADKITGLDINTTKLTVHSNDGKSTWTDNTIQIADADRVRVQIGEDASGDYNIYIWDPSGNLMWNATGATAAGLNDGIIKDVAVAADANISGNKLDIESVIREVNGATTTIKGTRIKLDEQNQTLDAAFTSLKTYAEGVNSKTESNTTAISVAQGQISTLISNTTIIKDGQTVQLKDAFNSTVADVNSIKTTINEHTSLIDQQSGEILAVTTKANTIESDLNGTKQTVSAVQSDLSGTKSRVSTVESGLDGLKTRVSATETSLSKKADGTTVDSLTSRVATAESTINGFQASLTATNKTVSDNYTVLNSKIDGIEVGGRNLLLKSKDTSRLAPEAYNAAFYFLAEELVNGERYTIQINATTTSEKKSIALYIGGGNVSATPFLPTVTGTKTYIYTFTATASMVSAANHVNVYCSNNSSSQGSTAVTGKCTVNWIKLEKGTKATDWSPAPEDVDSVLNTHTEQISTHDTRITANANAINLKVSTSDYNAYKTTVNNEIASAKSRLSTAESSITAMQGQIALKVSQTDIDTAVNNLQIGGRNIALKTSTEKTLTGNNISNQRVSIYNMSKDWVEFAGKYIVISFDYTFSNDAVCTNSSYTNACIGIGMGASTWNRPAYIPAPSVAKSGHVIKSFFVSTNVSSHSFIQARLDYVTGTCTISNLKFELGTKATDWTPAPEDIDASITAVDAKFANYSTTTQMTAAITAAKDSITQSVSSTYATKASVDTVSGKVTNLTSRVQTAESKLTKDSLVTTIGSYYATQTYADNAKASAISTAASDATTKANNALASAKSYTDAVEIGARNILLNSKLTENCDKWEVTGTAPVYTTKYGRKCAQYTHTALKNTRHIGQSVLGKLEPNTKYTFSCWALTENIVKGTTNFCIMLYHDGYYNNNGTSKWFGYGSKNFTINSGSGSWEHISWTFTTDSTKLKNATDMNVYVYTRDFTGSVYFCDLKLEKCTKATDWSPAPEDMESSIASVQTIATQTANKFNWLVKSGTSATDFTLTDRTATLVANAINLKGLVTFSGLDSAAQGKINTIDSINSFKFFTSNYSQSQSTLDSWAAEGKDAGNWTVVEGTTGVRVGDMAAIRCYNTTTSAYVYILIKVTAISSATALKGISHGYIDPNATAAAATAQSTANTANTTANTAKTNAATAQSTADAAKSAAATAQSTANTAKSTADAAKSWTDTNGANMTNLRNMVLKWTNNAVSTSTYIQGGWIATNTITAAQIAAGAIVADKIAANAVTAAKIATDAIKSRNYAYSSGNYSTAGTFLDLSNGVIRSKNFGIDASGNAYIKGKFYSSNYNAWGNEWTSIDESIIKGGINEAYDSLIDLCAQYSDGRRLVIENNQAGILLKGSEISIGETGAEVKVNCYNNVKYRPIGSADSDKNRVSWISSTINNGTYCIVVNGLYGSSNYIGKRINIDSSDIRLKENILPTKVEALPVLNSINLYQFDWRQDHYHQRIGFVADYLEKADDHLVIGGGYDEYGNINEKSVNNFYLMGYVVKGIQEICTWTANYAAETDRALTSVRAELDCTRNTAVSNQQRIARLEAKTQADNQSIQAQLQQALNRIAEQEKLIRQLQAAAG